ncbi:hypothetical protein JCM10213_001705 [Rhodosporidiobolus nylandii]
MAHLVKRRRSSSPSPAPAPPACASRAIQSSIALLSSSPDVPADLFARLLASLGEAHGLAVKQEAEADEQDRKRVKREEDEPAQREMRQAEVQTEEEKAEEPLKPPMPRWGLSNVQGELSELERMILRDVEAGLPLLDKLGILLRPVKAADGKVDLLEWEAALPMPTDSNWARSLPKPRLFFHDQYPQGPPKIKMLEGFFHPNCYPSGTVGAARKGLSRLRWGRHAWGDMLEQVYEKYGIEATADRAKLGQDFASLPPTLRLPILLEIHRQVLAYENLDDPTQLEPYQLAKAQVQQLVLTMLPTPPDHGDLIQAQRRAEWRKATGQEPSMLGE